MIDNEEKLKSALDAISPSSIDYKTWTLVGMALKAEGANVSMWDTWSQRDPDRYHSGECQRKWQTFGKSGEQVKLGTIYKIAQDNGWSYIPAECNHILSWDSVISTDAEVFTSEKINSDILPGEELALYLEALFKPDEYVGYVVEATQNDNDKWVPASKGHYDRTAAELIASLRKHPDRIDDTIGTTEPKAGAWIRVNPCDGKGIRDNNVTAYRHVLVESDTLSIDVQRAEYERLKLPIVALVESGGKSLHAIVRIDAPTKEKYQDRVNFLYKTLADEGFSVDTQNKNPLRLSRMPGVDRNGHHQRLVATNIGAKSWDDWIALRKQSDLPQVESFDAAVFTNPPPLAPAIIDGILRQGHKMIISGDSKAGKTWLLIQLAAALSEGTDWLGFECKKSKVLYFNLEIDKASFTNRLVTVYKALNLTPSGNLLHIDMRGKAEALDKLAPAIISLTKQTGANAVIIDPIYKIITGDENNASEMGAFCNLFDAIAQQTGAAVIYSHHHAKGMQGTKKAIDRGSGSGVFARDPDAIIDLTAIDMTDEDDANHNQPEPLSFESTIGGDTANIQAFQISGCLREFASFEPFNVIREFPLLKRDFAGITSNKYVEGDPRNNLKQSKVKPLDWAQIKDAYQIINQGNGVTREELCVYLNKSQRTLREILNKYKGEWIQDKGRFYIN